jgi:hypothetical protein
MDCNKVSEFKTFVLWDSRVNPDFDFESAQPSREFFNKLSLLSRINAAFAALICFMKSLISDDADVVRRLVAAEAIVSQWDRKQAVVVCLGVAKDENHFDAKAAQEESFGTKVKPFESFVSDVKLCTYLKDNCEGAFADLFIWAGILIYQGDRPVSGMKIQAVHHLKPAGATSEESDFARTFHVLGVAPDRKLMELKREAVVQSMRELRLQIRQFQRVGKGDSKALKEAAGWFVESVNRWNALLTPNS